MFMYTMLMGTVSVSLLLLITAVGPARLHNSRELIEDYSVATRGKRGTLSSGAKLLSDISKAAVKNGKMLLKLWEVERRLLSGAKLHARQFAVDHYVKLGDMKEALEDFFSIRNRLQDIRMERYPHGDEVTYITRVGNRVVKLKQNYREKSSVITFLRPGTPDQREMGIVVHYCKMDRGTFCKVDIPPGKKFEF